MEHTQLKKLENVIRSESLRTRDVLIELATKREYQLSEIIKLLELLVAGKAET